MVEAQFSADFICNEEVWGHLSPGLPKGWIVSEVERVTSSQYE